MSEAMATSTMPQPGLLDKLLAERGTMSPQTAYTRASLGAYDPTSIASVLGAPKVDPNATTPRTLPQIGGTDSTGFSLGGMLGGIGDFTTKYADGINAVSGLGGLGLGLANYLQASDMYDKQMRAMDQQYAFNEAAKANKENIASDFRTSLAG